MGFNSGFKGLRDLQRGFYQDDPFSQIIYSEYQNKSSPINQDQYSHLKDGKSVTGYKSQDLYRHYHYTNQTTSPECVHTCFYDLSLQVERSLLQLLRPGRTTLPIQVDCCCRIIWHSASCCTSNRDVNASSWRQKYCDSKYNLKICTFKKKAMTFCVQNQIWCKTAD